MKNKKSFSAVRQAFRLVLVLIVPAFFAFGEDFYSWPPHPSLPAGPDAVYFDWTPLENDPHGGDAVLDLRYLNEAVAGQDGWVCREGDKFHLANGEAARFWSVNIGGNHDLEVLRAQARCLAKRGVNMARVHGPYKSLVDQESDNINDVDMSVVDQMHKVVAAMKEEGIYTFVSNTFYIITMTVRAEWNVLGYTQEWLDANPGKQVPFGLIFFDETLRNAYRNWLTVLMTTPNPYEASQTPLAEDTSVAIVELLNEENVFFNTFDPARWPEEQRRDIFHRFFTWVGEKHLDPEDPEDTIEAAAERAYKNVWGGLGLAQDDLEQELFALQDAARMALNPGRLAARMADQLEFLAGVQRDFFAEMTELLRGFGYEAAVSATNWKTANDKVLLDLEFHTYTAGDVIDSHNYFSPAAEVTELKYRVSAGDQFVSFPFVANPRRGPVTVKQVKDYPFSISESTWVNYNPAAAEGPLTVAAYLSLADADHWTWFALGPTCWADAVNKWPVGSPSIMGQFPGAALLYRRGDVAEAPVVVSEGRTLRSLYEHETAIIMPGHGFDPTRDDPDTYDGDPLMGPGAVDALAMLAGKAELNYETDDDFVSPLIDDLIDIEAGAVTSVTGQMTTDWNSGVMKIDTPLSQGATGFLKEHGEFDLTNVAIRSNNGFGAVLAISLDGMPLSQSAKILLQTGTHDQPAGFETSFVEMEWGDSTRTGYQIDSLGAMPWQVERVDAEVTLKGMAARISDVKVLDEDGYPRESITGTAQDGNYVVSLPGDAIYTVVELTPPEDLTPVILTRALPNATAGEEYYHELKAAGGDGSLSWYMIEEDANGNLGDFLSVSPGGVISGTPGDAARGIHFVTLGVEDEDLDSGIVLSVPLTVLPLPDAGLWGELLTEESRWTSLGWIYDGHYPFIWIWAAEAWGWVWPDSTRENILIWMYQDGGYWTWASQSLPRWRYNFGGPNPGWQFRN